jgi:hypothetical protein
MEYTINEGFIEVKRVNYLINYNLGKTSIENCINEQETAYTRFLDKKLSTAKGAEELIKSNQELIANALEYFDSSWDHETAGNIELGLTFIGFALTATGIGAPIGVFFIGAGTAVGVLDAVKYYREDNPYMGTMMLALQLIPGGELISILAKKSPQIAKVGLPKIAKILEKINNNKTLTDLEGKIFNFFSNLVAKSLPDISKVILRYSKIRIKQGLQKLGLKKVVMLLLHFSKLFPFLGKMVIKIGRISVTVDLLWTLLATPDSWRMKMRDKAEFSKIMDMLYDGTLSSHIIDGLWVLWQRMWNKDGTLNDTTVDEINSTIVNVTSEKIEKSDLEFNTVLDSISNAKPSLPSSKWETLNDEDFKTLKNEKK